MYAHLAEHYLCSRRNHFRFTSLLHTVFKWCIHGKLSYISIWLNLLRNWCGIPVGKKRRLSWGVNMKMGHTATRRGKIAVPTIVKRKWTQLCQESIAISSNVGEGHILALVLPCVCARAIPCFVFSLNPKSGEEEKANKIRMKISSRWIELRWMQGRQYMKIYDDIPLP